MMKVLRLCPESVYAELQIGVLKLTLGRHLDAIEHFRSVNMRFFLVNRKDYRLLQY